MKHLAILGSTGSIGTQTLEVVDALGTYQVDILSAHRNKALLYEQVRKYQPKHVFITDKTTYEYFKGVQNETPFCRYHYLWADYADCLEGIDCVIGAITGAAGIEPVLDSLRAGLRIGLANKETMVEAGDLVNDLLAEHGGEIIPVDSEHSAIFQCLEGRPQEIAKIILTASGGPFRTWESERFQSITRADALKHPNWSMGAKITIDSSTLVNKGFEVIEAHWLFGTPAERISVLLHPQSIIHSMVEFEDGAIKAQLGTPDMRLPISFALLYPDRANRPGERFNFLNHPQLTFAEVDRAKYPALDIAYDCLRRGGTAACTMNGANEVAVAAFLARKCAWLDIVRAIRYALEHAAFVPSPTLADYAEANAEARALAAEFLQLKN